ncbi:Asp23/Gls24 family envelope stress response protein [Hoyosella altamirensis]|uniref:Putative alkaline shock family protein YloU n=1 Tax=Hoyosella altamirensis TaxID=616997 RepID=A0A839RN83_9ACTN|nr:Asp23/Gls24 family envelope stress response protein [Hoyosella altamirensis]MBB3037769.1 putative alkaline shock family protein YloU [Hoyosella altamirensis]
MAEQESQLRDPEDRGRLDLDDRVVESVVRQVTASLPGAVATSTKLSKLLGRSYPRVEVRIAGGQVRVAVETAVAWPRPAGEVCRQLKRDVVDRLQDITGLAAARVDVTAHYLTRVHEDHPGAKSLSTAADRVRDRTSGGGADAQAEK